MNQKTHTGPAWFGHWKFKPVLDEFNNPRIGKSGHPINYKSMELNVEAAMPPGRYFINSGQWKQGATRKDGKPYASDGWVVVKPMQPRQPQTQGNQHYPQQQRVQQPVQQPAQQQYVARPDHTRPPEPLPPVVQPEFTELDIPF